MHKLYLKTHTLITILLFVLLSYVGVCQSKKALQLQKEVFDFNNQFQYDKAQAAVHAFLKEPQLTNEDGYYANIYMSHIYKRLFDYDAVLQYLDKALEFGNKTAQKNNYINNIICQKALAYFDIHQYDKADSLMRLLSLQQYQYLDDEHVSKIMMQEGYILYLAKFYSEAEKHYNEAIQKMQLSSPFDLPMIYGKLIQLHGATKNEKELLSTYQKSIAKSDSCGILKYKMYTIQMMMKAYHSMQKHKEAFLYNQQFDSISEVYNQSSHLQRITELEKKFELSKKEQEIILQKEKVKNSETKVFSLMLGIVILALASIAFVFWYRQRALLKSKQDNLTYTKQLFENIEQERKRIATDIHDSVGHELLSLKNNTSTQNIDTKIDAIISDVRMISRNLHPVLFDELGLKLSLENLLERLQHQHGIVFTLDINYDKQLSKHAELQLYRMIQEALSNSIKYSETIAVKVNIAIGNQQVVTQIMDSGKGFNVTETLASSKAFGLHSIMQRCEALGGKAHIHSEPHKTLIELIIPVT